MRPDSELIPVLVDAAEALQVSQKRLFMARTVHAMGRGGQRRAQEHLGWYRETVRKGIHEHRTVMTCADAFHCRRRKPAEEPLPRLLDEIRSLADDQSQADPKFQTNRLKTGTAGGFNAVEARRVATLVLALFRDQPGSCLGVIAFNQRQQVAILDELEKLRAADPALETFFDESRGEPFFVKNLENAQGDERDAIFLSVGYGPDENGKVAMRFGPLNRDGGVRRLNVAITRARSARTVVSSMRASAIDVARAPALGARLLRSYLDFAERGVEALRSEITQDGDRDFDSPFEREVFRALERRGMTVHRQVGWGGCRVDLALVDPAHPGRFVLGVECDGATYHGSATARDRDRLRQQVLEGLGWRICRIWSTDWFLDPDGKVERVLGRSDRR